MPLSVGMGEPSTWGTFARQTKFEGDLFFSTCEEVEARLKIGGGISHYLLDAHGVCRAVWTGMPVKPEYEEKILRRDHAASEAVCSV